MDYGALVPIRVNIKRILISIKCPRFVECQTRPFRWRLHSTTPYGWLYLIRLCVWGCTHISYITIHKTHDARHTVCYISVSNRSEQYGCVAATLLNEPGSWTTRELEHQAASGGTVVSNASNQLIAKLLYLIRHIAHTHIYIVYTHIHPPRTRQGQKVASWLRPMRR